MTDDAKPQAVPKCEHEWRTRKSGNVICRFCGILQPTQAVGDEDDSEECGGQECRWSATETIYHEGCDGRFCFHGICRECGTTMSDDPTDAEGV